jgi:hypothetical protein
MLGEQATDAGVLMELWDQKQRYHDRLMNLIGLNQVG